MCTGGSESSVYEFDTLLGLRHFTLCPLFALRGKTTLGSPGVAHSSTHPLPLHKSKSTREHLRTGDMAGLGKSKERYTRNLLEREWQAGKVSVLERRPVSALLVMSEISNESPCRGNTAYNARTCAYPRPRRAEHCFLTGV